MVRVSQRLGLAVAGLLLLSTAAHAQCAVNSNYGPPLSGGGNVFGSIVSQWVQYFKAKVDANNGASCGEKLANPIINGVPVNAGFLQSVTAPLQAVNSVVSLLYGAVFTVNGSNQLDLSYGTSVVNPGTNHLEMVLPVQAVTGASAGSPTTCGWLFKKTRRSNSGSAMSDTLPASTCVGLVNGSRIVVANADASAADALTAGAGTSLSASCASVPAGKEYSLEYDLAMTTWRGSANTCLPFVTSANSGGFVNVLRGNSLTQSYLGSNTITTAGGWTAAEGVYCVPTGASVTTSLSPAGAGIPTYNGLSIVGASSNTGVTCRWVIESYSASPIANKTATFQVTVTNSAGSTITPTIATKYPSAQDSWGSPVTDLSATNLQSCTNTSTCTLTYTLAVSGNASNGYEVLVHFPALPSGADSILLAAFDFRATPGVATGLNASPPTPEVRDPASDANWNQRFFWSTYDNGVAPGTSSTEGGRVVGAAQDVTTSRLLFLPKVPMRCGNGTPTFYSPVSGTSGKFYDVTTSADITASANTTATQAFDGNATITANDVVVGHATLDCRIAGG